MLQEMNWFEEQEIIEASDVKIRQSFTFFIDE